MGLDQIYICTEVKGTNYKIYTYVQIYLCLIFNVVHYCLKL